MRLSYWNYVFVVVIWLVEIMCIWVGCCCSCHLVKIVFFFFVVCCSCIHLACWNCYFCRYCCDCHLICCDCHLLWLLLCFGFRWSCCSWIGGLWQRRLYSTFNWRVNAGSAISFRWMHVNQSPIFSQIQAEVKHCNVFATEQHKEW